MMLSACVAVHEGPTKKEKASNINVQLGIGYLQQNNLEVANQKLLRALDQNPESAVAHNAFAILQERLLQFDVAEKHYQKAAQLDPKNSQANNNYGAFLCRKGRELESEQYFLKAVKQPLYKTPEFAYTNAAVCLMKVKENERALEYLKKALAARSNFATALINLSDLHLRMTKPKDSLFYLQRYHLVKNATSRSLWLEIQANLALEKNDNAIVKIDLLKKKFPKSKEFKELEALNL